MSKKKSILLPILRYNDHGIMVGSYKQLSHIMPECNISYYKLVQIIISGESYKGFVYKPANDVPQSVIAKILGRDGGTIEPGWEPYWDDRQPWEGKDGFFDIKGWSKSIY